MKFKGEPNRLCRITKIQKSLVRKIPKSIRFNGEGIFETENPHLIKRLKTKFKVVEDVVVVEEKIEIIEEKQDISKKSYKELQKLYTGKTNKTAVGKKKSDLIEELEG